MNIVSNDDPAISLIIPVYNVEKYIKKALDSVVNQTMKNIQVIIVNDGSTDNSINIVEDFARKNSNFTIINQDNKGLAAARNAGLKIAKGKYIAFMDSDDYIEPNFLECLYKLAKDNDADISCCNYNIYLPNINANIYMPIATSNGVYKKEEALNKLIRDITLHHFSWNKLYKRELFNNHRIEFYNMCFEDISTSPRLFYNANKIAITSKAPYHYTMRKGSILNTMNVCKINDYTRSFGSICDFLFEKDDYRKYKHSILIYGVRVTIVNWYSVIRMHAKALNFDGCIKNCKNVFKDVSCFMNSDYSKNDKLVSLKWPVKEPIKKVKIPIKKKKACSKK